MPFIKQYPSFWVKKGCLCFIVICTLINPLLGLDLFWPTDNASFLEGKNIDNYIQPTASGKPESGLFGCSRNDGYRFHGGVDLKSIKKDKKGEALDPIYAIMTGRLVYFNKIPANSSYGRYIVIEHKIGNIPLLSLYAHLSTIKQDLVIGQIIKGGEQIGIMGHSANSVIPKNRSHLHLEIGLRLSDNFQAWYNLQNFGTPNKHGIWNGINIVSLDPLSFFKYNDANNLKLYLNELPTAFVVHVNTSKIPDFIKKSPEFVSGGLPKQPIYGWNIEFTHYGLPKKWIPIYFTHKTPSSAFKIDIINCDIELMRKNQGTKMVSWNKKGQIMPGRKLKQLIEILFI